MPPASPATACTRSTARTASSSIACARPARRTRACGRTGAFRCASVGRPAAARSRVRAGPAAIACDVGPPRTCTLPTRSQRATAAAASHRRATVPLAPPVLAAADARTLAGGFSIARQLGLGVSRIVIDPGHGGHDPGAKGKGTTEAELVLDVALRLEKLLQKVPGVEVILTRRTDDFVPLQERTAIANREGADLFLSIHANASTNGQAHGIETYFPELREQPERRRGRRARERGVRAGDGRAARLREGDRAQQQARRVARLRDLRAARDDREAEAAEQDREGSRREAGAVRRADRRGDAERAGGDVVRDQRAGSEAVEGERLPAADRGVAVQRDPEVSDVAEERTTVAHQADGVRRKRFGRVGS